MIKRLTYAMILRLLKSAKAWNRKNILLNEKDTECDINRIQKKIFRRRLKKSLVNEARDHHDTPFMFNYFTADKALQALKLSI